VPIPERLHLSVRDNPASIQVIKAFLDERSFIVAQAIRLRACGCDLFEDSRRVLLPIGRQGTDFLDGLFKDFDHARNDSIRLG
jgi:hypothetical protein